MKKILLAVFLVLFSSQSLCSMRDALDIRDAVGIKFSNGIVNYDSAMNSTYIEIEKKLDDEWSVGGTQGRTVFIDPNREKYRWMDRVFMNLELSFNRQVYADAKHAAAVLLGFHYQDLTYGEKALYPQVGFAVSNKINDSLSLRLSALTDGYVNADIAINMVHGWELVISGRSEKIMYDALLVAVGMNYVFTLQ